MPSPIQLQRLPRRKKPAPTRALLFLVLLALFVCAGLSGCSAQAADAPSTTAADLKRAAAGAWACPGMEPIWLDDRTVQCLRGKQ
ncbi:hypothetical protein P245_25615 [Comamonas thiooxydans]|uniref:Uncharacterized protein n=1 Tax=Comamonas thiooxydans TaxID=363952 RepID=A0A0E3B7P3_9BURK|nr:hypothetical protein [Comamonas thiooxydans]KGG82857.1 hypothetical protein P245_25615 [Comamonas thiooxydans]